MRLPGDRSHLTLRSASLCVFKLPIGSHGPRLALRVSAFKYSVEVTCVHLGRAPQHNHSGTIQGLPRTILLCTYDAAHACTDAVTSLPSADGVDSVGRTRCKLRSTNCCCVVVRYLNQYVMSGHTSTQRITQLHVHVRTHVGCVHACINTTSNSEHTPNTSNMSSHLAKDQKCRKWLHLPSCA